MFAYIKFVVVVLLIHSLRLAGAREGRQLRAKRLEVGRAHFTDLLPRQNAFSNLESFSSMFRASTFDSTCITVRTSSISSSLSKMSLTQSSTSSIRTTSSVSATRSTTATSSSTEQATTSASSIRRTSTLTSSGQRTSITASSTRRPSTSTSSTHRTSTTTSTSSLPRGTTTCHQPLNDNSPSESTLLNLLNPSANLAQWCSGKFPPGSPLSITFNIQEYFITVLRKTNSPLQFCTLGLNAIISSCIEHQSFYGGSYVQGSESYNISNNNYPGSPVIFTTTSSTPTPTPTAPTLTLSSADSSPQATCGTGATTKFFTFPINVEIAAGVGSLVIDMPVADQIPGSDWQVFFLSNNPSPSSMFTNWEVFADGPIPIDSGDSSTLNSIRWTSPNDVSGTKIDFLVNKQNSDRTFQFQVLGDAPCSSTTSSPPTPTQCPSADTTGSGDLKCPLTESSLLAPRSDCSGLLSNLPSTSSNTLSAANCISGTSGTNAFGQLFCSLAVNGNCALILVFGDETAQQLPQDRDSLAALINDANSQCFAVCPTDIVEAARIQGSAATNNQNTRACVINAGQGANC